MYGSELLCFHDRFGHFSAHAGGQGDINRLAFVLPSIVVDCAAFFVFDCRTFFIESKATKIKIYEPINTVFENHRKSIIH